jgi:hypothetical protein
VNATVDVIVDREDDIATVRAVHQLAAREPGVLPVNIAPGTRAEPALVWAILRALGKRIEQLERSAGKVWWMDAERWLLAHRVSEVAALGAQHLSDGVTEELEAQCGKLGIALTLVYGGRVAARRAVTTTLDAYLARQRRPPASQRRSLPWPRVPRSHPLRLRYDCSRQLAPADFGRVEQLLRGSLRTLGAWRWCMGRPAHGEIARVLAVLIAADDPEQAYVRRCGAELALLCDQIPVPPTRPLRLDAQTPTGEQVETIRAYTDPATAGYQLAKVITGLPDDLLALVGGDQITDQTILGCPVPEPARAILRAIDHRHEPVLGVTAGPVRDPIEDVACNEDEQEFASAIGWLLRGRSARIPARELPAQLRSQFAMLHTNGILELSGGIYTASDIAHYSSFQPAGAPDAGTDAAASCPPAPAMRVLTNERDGLLT